MKTRGYSLQINCVFSFMACALWIFPLSTVPWFIISVWSSIEHGGTNAIYIFMAQLALFNEGVRHHFPICGNFCEVLLVAGVFILFSLHMTMVWDLANGTGIPAPSDAIDVCVSKHQSALIRGDGDSSSTAGPKA